MTRFVRSQRSTDARSPLTGDIWSVLSAGTGEVHSALDNALSALPLQTPTGVEAFMAAMAAAVPGVEAGLTDAAAGTPLSRWAVRRRAGTLPYQPHSPLALDGEPAAWGAAYVLEGSRLGGRLLSRDFPLLAAHPFFADAFAPSVWAQFLTDLRRADARLQDRPAMLDGAHRAFRVFSDAVHPLQGARSEA